MRIVFMGSPVFAVPSLEGLVAAGHEVTLVVTQPDRPVGRGRRLEPPPVARRARALGLPLYQPAGLRHEEAVARLRAARPDVIVVVAYGRILPPAVLTLPPLGCLNVHASLLPRHRGASPIQAALLAGDPETGVCIMLMDEGLDTGPILACASTPILPEDDVQTLTARLAVLGRDLLLPTLTAWAAGELQPQPQDESRATFTRPVRKSDGLIDWHQPAVVIARQVRAYKGWPGAYTTVAGQQLRIEQATPIPWAGEAAPGTLVRAPGPSGRPVLAVVCGEGALVLETVLPAGARPMSGEAFLAGRPGLLGQRLGS